MNPRVIEFLPGLSDENSDLFLRPSQSPRKRSYRHRLEKEIRILVIPYA